ncbi:MAG: hypothetical protein C4291_14795 [Candidatus Dadabacteria bacterium]
MNRVARPAAPLGLTGEHEGNTERWWGVGVPAPYSNLGEEQRRRGMEREKLEEMVELEGLDGFERERLAQSSQTPLRVLEALAKDWRTWVRQAVAGNHNTPPELLEQLGRDEMWQVRVTVAHRPEISERLIEELARDPKYLVRCGVANNPSTPPELLIQLVRDRNRTVRETAARVILRRMRGSS